MLLAIDIGNTDVTCGAFEDDALQGVWRLRTDPTRTADEYGGLLTTVMGANGFSREGIDAVMICSVVPALTRTFQEVCPRYFEVSARFVTHETPTGIRFDVDYPSEVGADRIVNSVAAQALYGTPAVVVDFGTATTFDVVKEGGVYAGGLILPGINISMNALFDRAARLSRIDLRKPPSVIGRNTETCLQSGYHYGFLGQTEWLLERVLAELGVPARVIATGGLAGVVGDESALIEIVDPNLTLKGLTLIHRRLAEKSAASDGDS